MKRVLIAVLALAACAGQAPAQTTADAMAPLIGCWRGAFEGNADVYDERCFTVLNGAVTDEHIVLPVRYAGEATYHYDDAARQHVFAYAASDGGRSNGVMVAGEGALEFPEHTFRAQDGHELRMRARWTFESADRYVSVSEIEEGSVWRPHMRIIYTRAPDMREPTR